MSRWRYAWAGVVGLVLGCALGLGPSTVIAAPRHTCVAANGCVPLTPTPNPLPGSNFQGGDGNQADQDGHIDWQGLLHEGRLTHQVDPNPHPGNQDDSFTSGSKELSPSTWTLTRSSVTPSDDILDVYRSFEHEAGHDAFLYLAFARASSTGTTFLTFELNRRAEPWRFSNGHAVPCREDGDLLISFTQHGNHSADTFAYVQEWETNATDPTTGCATQGHLHGVSHLTSADVQAAFNGHQIDRHLPGQTTGPGGSVHANHIDRFGFGEVAINITRVLGDLGEECSEGNFLSIWAHSRASESLDSAMKDYVAPQPFVVGVCKAHPRLSSTASPSVTVGSPIYDTAHLSDGRDPMGTITFRLFRPGDRRCSRRPIFRRTVPVDGNGPYTSPTFPTTRPGTYRWTVTYSGDDNNEGVGPVGCDASETVRVTKAVPELETVASQTTVLPGPIHDTATLTGGVNPRGTITFKVFSPSDTGCASPVKTFTVDVHGNGTYPTPNFTPTEAGTWRWIATYSGDANNAGAGPTACGAPGEETAVSSPPLGTPDLTTTATPTATAGSAIQDTAHLTGGSGHLTGSIAFYVYGPNDSTCSGPPAAPPSIVPVSGAGDYTSAPFTPTEPGTYHWRAVYSGDGNNEGAGPTACNETGENSVVSKATPTITTSASPDTAPYRSEVSDTATLSGGADPTGTITFRLYGPGDDSCTGPPAFVVEVEVVGNGLYTSPKFASKLSGAYRWVAVYSGDARNASASTRCGDPGESLVVGAAPPVHPGVDEPEHAVKPKPKPKPKPSHRPKPRPPQPPFTG